MLRVCISGLVLVWTRQDQTGGDFPIGRLAETETRLQDPGLVAWEILDIYFKEVSQ